MKLADYMDLVRDRLFVGEYSPTKYNNVGLIFGGTADDRRYIIKNKFKFDGYMEFALDSTRLQQDAAEVHDFVKHYLATDEMAYWEINDQEKWDSYPKCTFYEYSLATEYDPNSILQWFVARYPINRKNNVVFYGPLEMANSNNDFYAELLMAGNYQTKNIKKAVIMDENDFIGWQLW